MSAKAKYDRIGIQYDTTRRADPFLLDRLAHHLNLDIDKKYLDLACGSGNYTSALAALGGHWTGIDQSSVMLENARAKSTAVEWHQGLVNELPFKDGAFDGVTCTLAIHHFDLLGAAFREVRRVLKGRFILFTSTSEQMEGYWLHEYFPEAMKRSVAQMPAIGEIREALSVAGLEIIQIEPYSIRRDLEDFFLYSGKHRPEMYLDAAVRKGISTFSSLADAEEVVEGCTHLAEDIDSGRIDDVIASFENDLGDYCFALCSGG